jgi:ankyrin repeat protein
MEIAKVLLENGADPRRPDKDRWSCLHECIEK